MLLIVFLILTLSPVAQARELTAAEMREDLHQLCHLAKTVWSHYEMRRTEFGLDLDALCRRLETRIDNRTTEQQFDRILREFVAELQDGHAHISLAGPSYRLPFRLCEVDQKIIVDRVLYFPSAFHPGDRVLKIGGQPVQTLLEDSLKVTASSSPGQRRVRAVDALVRVASPEPLAVELESLQGELFTVCCCPEQNLDWDDSLTWRCLPHDLEYLRLASFGQDQKIVRTQSILNGSSTTDEMLSGVHRKVEALQAAFRELSSCRGLVLDLRDNQGGTDILGEILGQALAPQTPTYYELETPLSAELKRIPGFAEAKGGRYASPVMAPEKLPPFHGRLAILMNERSFSATDNFLNFIACARPDALLVGSPNGAGSGAPRPVGRLEHSGAVFTCCVMRVWNARGTPIEGHPLKVNLSVRPTREDIADGRDAVLEAAVQALDRPEPRARVPNGAQLLNDCWPSCRCRHAGNAGRRPGASCCRVAFLTWPRGFSRLPSSGG